jgi:hypothetical protein
LERPRAVPMRHSPKTRRLQDRSLTERYLIKPIEQEQKALAREIQELMHELQGYLTQIADALNALRENVAVGVSGKGYIN